MERDTEKLNAGRMRAIRLLHGFVSEKLDPDKSRAAKENFGSLLSRTMNVTVEEGFVGSIPIEWIRPHQNHSKETILLYCHGGGYVTGCMKYSRSLTAKLAHAANRELISFDYSLAPEHPYPAALEEAEAVWNHLLYLGYGSKNIIVAGDSAGGNLALALTLRLKEQKRKLPGGLLLFSPWTDMTCSGESYQSRMEVDPILDEAYIKDAVAAYANGQNLKNPLISPLFGNFDGFPPVLLETGDNEILLSDSTSLYKAMKKADVPVKMKLYPGMWHVFQMSPFKPANDAISTAADFIFQTFEQ